MVIVGKNVPEMGKKKRKLSHLLGLEMSKGGLKFNGQDEEESQLMSSS